MIKKEFLCNLIFTEFHKNDNGGEFIEFLLRNKIDISDQYIEISTNNHLISQMKYTNEELLNIKKLGELLKK